MSHYPLYSIAGWKEDVLQGEERDGAQEGGRGEGRQGRCRGEFYPEKSLFPIWVDLSVDLSADLS